MLFKKKDAGKKFIKLYRSGLKIFQTNKNLFKKMHDVFFKKKDAEKQSINYNWPGLKVTECILT